MISQRIAEILKRPGVEPKNIVAFTFTEKAAAELKDVDAVLLPETLTDALPGYRRLLVKQNYFDFTELLRLTIDLLDFGPGDDMAGPLVRHVWNDIKYVVVDEYQDTDPIQEKLIERLCRYGANLCVVGDDDQTIYQ